MRYVSTRQAPGVEPVSFETALLDGLAPDGGLYVPTAWPHFDADAIADLRGLDYPALAARIVAPFLGDLIPPAALGAIARDAYAGFDHRAVAPLRQLGSQSWLLELFHGPTLSFKDYALQVVGRLFDHVLAESGRRLTILGATSGDTGSAAIEACRDRAHLDVFILYPKGRTSAVQRRQMTTVASPNVHAIAIDGTFDDCQDLVKALFADLDFRRTYGLSAVNSINWARIVAQIVYYFAAATALGAPGQEVAFAVPTGNFGNIFAGHAARSMGLPIAGLILGTNRNDILYRYIQSGAMVAAAVEPSLSPSMDIQISSNFERLLFEASGRNGPDLEAAMRGFRASGALPALPGAWDWIRARFAASRVDDDTTSRTIAEVYASAGMAIDPHSAVAVAAGRQHAAGFHQRGIPVVALACAHAAKFPDAVEAATGIRPALPPALADLFVREERLYGLPKDLDAVRRFVAGHVRK